MKLADYGARARNGGTVLVLAPINGSPRVRYRIISDLPSRGVATVQRDGATLTLGDLAAHMRLDGPVAHWLSLHTFVDVGALVRELVRNGGDAPACLPLLAVQARDARRATLRSIDTGFDPRAHSEMVCLLARGVTHVGYDGADGEPARAIGSREEVEAELTRAGYRIEWGA